MKQLVLGILAHVDAGKTTLSEALLYRTGAIRDLGRVDYKNAHMDTHALERARGITIFSRQARMTLGDTAVTLLDTPGHVDFSAEMERTLQVLDYAVLVISGTDGVQAHTQTLWQLLRRYRVYKSKSSGRTLRPGIVLDEENRRVLVNGQPLELTETEFSILHCLAENRGRVVPVRTIYETVWHETYMPASNNTVMVHIVNLRKKLEEDPANPRLIRTVWGKGYQID